ncbi:MAG: glycosyltransferase family 4 protein [Archaeoglobales archaeon]|nr:glycosyltransferase family 4 protein [Archaeoglobales archaeon]
MIKAGYSEKLEGEGIISMGWIKEADMPKLYNCADVYLHTSEYEGFGLPILEAMACGIPVVASNRASIPEVTGDAGVLVDLDYDCVDEFAENILRVLDKNKKIDKLALERSKTFSWERTARETLRVYMS